MAKSMRDGARYPYPEHSEALVDAVAQSTANIAKFVARAVVPRLPGFRRRDDLAVLDIGCGEGTAMLALATAFPNGRVVGLDVEPRSVEKARLRIRAAGLEGKVRAYVADASGLEFQSEFDLVTMLQVLHEVDMTARPEVLRRAHAALQRGGILLIVDEPYPDDPLALKDAPICVLTQFIESFWGNTFLSMGEQKRMVQEAGFQVLSQVVPPPGLICLTTAQKV
jgi:cyclopropane fatty-acyl-phospholipid synthase-like methyltransferase